LIARYGRGVSRTDTAEEAPSRTYVAAQGIAIIVGLLYVIEIADNVSGHALDRDLGLKTRNIADIWAIATSPFVHVGWSHLLGNTLPLLIFGFMVLLSGWREFARVCAIAIVAAGLGAWLFSPSHSITMGASGVIMGLLTYLLARGFYTRKISQILIALVTFALFGGLLWGLLPTDPHVSWQAHVGGAIGGVLAAYALRRPAEEPKPA
jgi:membrane associated rhomboid family serine protease